jgi:hypothetical protein
LFTGFEYETWWAPEYVWKSRIIAERESSGALAAACLIISIKCVFDFRLQLLFEKCFRSDKYLASYKMLAVTYTRYCSSLAQILMLQTPVKLPSIRFHETPFRDYQVITGGKIHTVKVTDSFCNFSVANALETGSKQSVCITDTSRWCLLAK